MTAHFALQIHFETLQIRVLFLKVVVVLHLT